MKTKTQRWQTEGEVFNGAWGKYRPLFCQQLPLNFTRCVSLPTLQQRSQG
ncbi:Uncharacterised protein [Serratia quinivorans]|nr:Uncharacterised protein [Serratia quinivorans]